MNTIKPPVTTPALEAAIDAAVGRGVRDAMVRHSRAGEDVAVSRDGKVIVVSALDVLTRMDAADSSSAAKKAS